MAELKDFKKFLAKEFPDMAKSQIDGVCKTSEATIEGSTASNRGILIVIAGRYGYESGNAESPAERFKEAKEFLGEKLGEQLAAGKGNLDTRVQRLEREVSGINEKLKAIPRLQAEVVRGASSGRAKLLGAQEAAFFESPESKRVAAVEATGKQVKELAESLRNAGYEIKIPPQTVHPELPRGVRDSEEPIAPLEEASFRHVSPKEEQIRNTALTMMVVKAPGSDTPIQIMNNSDGQLTMTKLNKGEAYRLPTVTAPNPPGSNVYADPQALRANLVEMSPVQTRERAKA